MFAVTQSLLCNCLIRGSLVYLTQDPRGQMFPPKYFLIKFLPLLAHPFSAPTDEDVFKIGL